LASLDRKVGVTETGNVPHHRRLRVYATVIRGYRRRLGQAVGEPQHDDLEWLAGFPAVAVPAITLDGDAGGAPPRDRSAGPAS
jgi:hypothetical protein